MPNQAVQKLGEAQRLENDGNFEAAKIAYVDVLDISPRPAAYLGLARIYTNEGDYSRALAYLQTAHETLPEDKTIEARLRLAENQMQQVQLQRVISGEAFEETLEEGEFDDTPTSASLYFARFETVVYDDPETTSPIKRFTLADALKLEEMEGTLLPLPEEDAISTVFFSGQNSVGTHGQGDFAMTSDPAFFIERSRIALDAGDVNRARTELLRALEVYPRNPEALIGLADLYDDLGETGRARELLVMAENAAPESSRVHYKMGNTYLRRGKAAESVKHYQKALELEPKNVYAQHNLGVAYLQMRKFPEAAEALNATIELDPGYAPTYRHLGNIAESYLGNKEQAISLYQEYLKRGGRDRATVEGWIDDLQNPQP
jgi:tetratricopeptide (TPR) repeat protein